MRRLIVVLAFAACLVPSTVGAQDREPHVHTDREGARVLPLPKEDGVFHFVVYGDRTGGPANGIGVLRQAVHDTNLLDPDLVMTVGDLIQGYNATRNWLAQMKQYRAVMGELNMPWYPVAGNHDVYWRGGKAPTGQHEANYEEHFGPLWYWFPHKNAAFVVLYTDEGDRETNKKGWGDAKVNQMSAEQLDWLRATLEQTRDKDHVFVFLHHPRWMANVYKGTNWDEVHAVLRDAGNVSAVFAGHVHRRRYDGARDGIEYYTLATTGGGIPFDVPGTGHMHHLDVVTVRQDGISVASLPVGEVLDPKEMTPERWDEIDALRALRIDHGTSQITVAADGAAAGAYRVSLPNPTTRPIVANLEIVVDDASWTFTPQHAHLRVEPETSAEVDVAYARDADGLEGFDMPLLTLQIDYVDGLRRVALPEREVALAFGVRDIAQDVFAAEPDGVLVLDGAEDCLMVPSAEVHVPDGPLTIEGWINCSTYAGRRAFMTKTETSEFGLFASDGKPSFSIYIGRKYLTAEPAEPMLKPDVWHHVAGVYDGAEARLYVDGKLVTRKAKRGQRRTNRLPLYIGADPDRRGNPVSQITGRVDEVRISTVARYSLDYFEPATRHEPDADTALLFHLDRPLGPFAPDHSQHGAHARERGNPKYALQD